MEKYDTAYQKAIISLILTVSFCHLLHFCQKYSTYVTLVLKLIWIDGTRARDRLVPFNVKVNSLFPVKEKTEIAKKKYSMLKMEKFDIF